MQTYSFKKGLIKGIVSLLAVGGAIVAYSGLGDTTIWDLLTQNLKPLLGSLTVGGLITIVVNYLKIKLNS